MDPESQTSSGKNGGVCGALGRACYGCFFESSSSSAAGYVRLFNTINAALLIFAGVYSFIDITNLLSLSISFYFLAAYLICFGCLLCCFEMRIGWFETRVRDSFGFLYTFVGRTFFLLFLATFCFGLISNQEALGLSVGIITAINAVFNCIIMYRHGSLFEDPSKAYNTAESTGATFVRNNPELAANALNAGVNAARNNPELAQAGMQAGRQYAREHPQDAANLAAGAYRSTVY